MEEINWKKRIDEIIVKKKKYKDPDFSAQRLADKLGLSTFQLARTLKKVYGKSYADIVLPLRVKDAKKHLTNPKKDNLTIEEIGILVGFKNKWSFFMAFRKYEGVSPGEVRKGWRLEGLGRLEG